MATKGINTKAKGSTTDNQEEVTPVDTNLDTEANITMKASHKSLKELLPEIKAKAFKKRVVTISYNDTRDNAQTDTIYLTSENQYFVAARYVPLNVPVELEECLIQTAKEARFLSHVPETINGKKTGNATHMMVRKYNVSEE